MYVSKAAAKRILEADPTLTRLGTIHTVRELKTVVQVTYSNNRKRCSTFISYKKFQADFIKVRQNGANQPCDISTINRVTGSFMVKMHSSDNAHCVTVNANGFSCTCEDYQNQVANGNGFTRPFCKHPIAIAYKLGYGSLNEYIKELKADSQAA